MPNDIKSTVSSAISDKNFFISSAISELRTYLVLAVINCANRNTSFLCFFIFLLSTCSPFNLRSFKSSHAFALNGIRQVGLNTGMPSTIICPVFSNSQYASFRRIADKLEISSSIGSGVRTASSSNIIKSGF